MLNNAQLDAIERIQSAIGNMEKLRRGINAAASSHDLVLKLGSFPALGMLVHEIDGLLFDHDCAAERAAADLPVRLAT